MREFSLKKETTIVRVGWAFSYSKKKVIKSLIFIRRKEENIILCDKKKLEVENLFVR